MCAERKVTAAPSEIHPQPSFLVEVVQAVAQDVQKHRCPTLRLFAAWQNVLAFFIEPVILAWEHVPAVFGYQLLLIQPYVGTVAHCQNKHVVPIANMRDD